MELLKACYLFHSSKKRENVWSLCNTDWDLGPVWSVLSTEWTKQGTDPDSYPPWKISIAQPSLPHRVVRRTQGEERTKHSMLCEERAGEYIVIHSFGSFFVLLPLPTLGVCTWVLHPLVYLCALEFQPKYSKWCGPPGARSLGPVQLPSSPMCMHRHSAPEHPERLPNRSSQPLSVSREGFIAGM